MLILRSKIFRIRFLGRQRAAASYTIREKVATACKMFRSNRLCFDKSISAGTTLSAIIPARGAHWHAGNTGVSTAKSWKYPQRAAVVVQERVASICGSDSFKICLSLDLKHFQ